MFSSSLVVVSLSARSGLVAPSLGSLVDAWAIGVGLSASFASATATEVEREFFYLFARLRVDHELAYRYPAIVAGVGVVLVVMVSCCREGIAGWRYSVLAAHGATPPRV